jgi:hypothetical protein
MESAKKSGVRISKAEVSLRPYPSSHSFCESFYKAWADGRQHRTPDFLALSRLFFFAGLCRFLPKQKRLCFHMPILAANDD